MNDKKDLFSVSYLFADKLRKFFFKHFLVITYAIKIIKIIKLDIPTCL